MACFADQGKLDTYWLLGKEGGLGESIALRGMDHSTSWVLKLYFVRARSIRLVVDGTFC